LSKDQETDTKERGKIQEGYLGHITGWKSILRQDQYNEYEREKSNTTGVCGYDGRTHSGESVGRIFIDPPPAPAAVI